MESLVREGVDVVFGIPGIHMSGIMAALRDESRIRMVTTRHEQASAHMADGYARVSGKPGVVLVVPGAGVYNAASGLATAYARSSPVLAIVVGQVPRDRIGKNLGAAITKILDQPVHRGAPRDQVAATGAQAAGDTGSSVRGVQTVAYRPAAPRADRGYRT